MMSGKDALSDKPCEWRDLHGGQLMMPATARVAEPMTTADANTTGATCVAPTRVSLLVTCVVDVLAPDIGEAAVRLLRAAGCEVGCDLSQTCCGRPAWSAGFVPEAATVARPTLDALEAELDRGSEVVVALSAGCAAMVRVHWPVLFDRAGDPVAAERARRVAGRTRELTELLAERTGRLPELRLTRSARVVLHRSCHLQRELRSAHLPTTVLDDVAGCELVEAEGSGSCCGFMSGPGPGQPDDPPETNSESVLHNAVDASAEVLVGTDWPCLLHLRSQAAVVGSEVEIRHFAELLGDALPAGAGWR
jgi:L-lactate dehydrogenase complex protein LldE